MEGVPDDSFAATIRAARRTKGLTLRSVAEKVGIDFTYLSKLENKRDDAPAEETIRRLATVLELDAEDLLARAGKVSTAIRDLAASDREFATFLRRLPDLPADEREKLYRRVRKRR